MAPHAGAALACITCSVVCTVSVHQSPRIKSHRHFSCIQGIAGAALRIAHTSSLWQNLNPNVPKPSKPRKLETYTPNSKERKPRRRMVSPTEEYTFINHTRDPTSSLIKGSLKIWVVRCVPRSLPNIDPIKIVEPFYYLEDHGT